jgi:hypothetical protein
MDGGDGRGGGDDGEDNDGEISFNAANMIKDLDGTWARSEERRAASLKREVERAESAESAESGRLRGRWMMMKANVCWEQRKSSEGQALVHRSSSKEQSTTS